VTDYHKAGWRRFWPEIIGFSAMMAAASASLYLLSIADSGVHIVLAILCLGVAKLTLWQYRWYKRNHRRT